MNVSSENENHVNGWMCCACNFYNEGELKAGLIDDSGEKEMFKGEECDGQMRCSDMSVSPDEGHRKCDKCCIRRNNDECVGDD